MAELIYDENGRLLFTEEMKNEYKILVPNMLPLHFTLIINIMKSYGYDLELLKTNDQNIIDQGLQTVHNDTCYPCLLVVGQFIDALQSGKYDVNKTALVITQTGGGCRASNYIHLLRKALKKAGYEQVPVISLNLSGMEKNPGFKITLPAILKMVGALLYADLLMMIANQLRPYEVIEGEVDRRVDAWINKLSEMYKTQTGLSKKKLCKNFLAIVEDFKQVQIKRTPKVRVGVVGEIYVKYSPLANNDLEKFLANEDCEVVVPGLLDFIAFKADNRIVDVDLYGGSNIKKFAVGLFKKYLLNVQAMLLDIVKNSGYLRAPAPFEDIKKMALEYVGAGNKMGEGWLLTGEMLELIHSGVENIVCTQPFGCLPNHIVGKGMVRKIKNNNPHANIVTIDYDPGATKVNQENRIKLMLFTAKDRLAEQINEKSLVAKVEMENQKENTVEIHTSVYKKNTAV